MKLPKWLTEWWKRIGESILAEEISEEEEYPYTACNSRARQHYEEVSEKECEKSSN